MSFICFFSPVFIALQYLNSAFASICIAWLESNSGKNLGLTFYEWKLLGEGGNIIERLGKIYILLKEYSRIDAEKNNLFHLCGLCLYSKYFLVTVS